MDDQTTPNQEHEDTERASEEKAARLAWLFEYLDDELDDPHRWAFAELMALIDSEIVEKNEKAISRLAEENHELDREVSYWRHFINESRRVFKDKRGLYGEMLDKALELLDEDCIHYAHAPEALDEQEELAKQFPEQMALVRQIHDDRTEKKWGKGRDMEALVRRYGWLTGYPTNRRPTAEDLARRERDNGALGRLPFRDREEAIKIITKEFKFMSPAATYKALYRALVKYLHPTWPKA